MDGNFSNKIFFSDEVHFTPGEYVNKQKCRICVSKNIQVIEERPLHPEKVTVWCALCSEAVIRSYFFEKYDGTAVIVNSERYGHMITEFFCLLLKNTTWGICDFKNTRLMLNNSSEYGFIARGISWPRNFSSWRYQLATKIIRLDTIRLFCGATQKTVFMQIKLQILST